MRQSLLTCSACGGVLDPEAAQRAEETRCPQCQTLHLVIPFPEALNETFAEEWGTPVVTADASACFYHPAKEATDTCAHCGRFLCRLCAAEVRHETWCANCIYAQTVRGGPAWRTRRMRRDKLALTVALFPWSCGLILFLVLAPFDSAAAAMVALSLAFGVSLFFGPISLYLALRHRRAGGILPERFRWRPWLAVALALVELALPLMAIIGFATSFMVGAEIEP